MTVPKKLPRVLVFASGDYFKGGTGFQELLENGRTGVLKANIVGVVSNHSHGGVRKIANLFEVPFHYMDFPFTAERYQEIIQLFKPDYIVLSGWLKKIIGHDPSKTINIHPGPKVFGGKGYHGIKVHKAVLSAWEDDWSIQSAVTIHFATEEFDKGPTIFEFPIRIREGETPGSLAARVNKIEHGWQSWVTNLVVHELITWSGVEGDPVVFPDWYSSHIPNAV